MSGPVRVTLTRNVVKVTMPDKIQVTISSVSGSVGGGFKKDEFTAAGTPGETFTITFDPKLGSVHFLRNDINLREGDWWSISGRVITMLRDLDAGDEMEAIYARD